MQRQDVSETCKNGGAFKTAQPMGWVWGRGFLFGWPVKVEGRVHETIKTINTFASWFYFYFHLLKEMQKKSFHTEW